MFVTENRKVGGSTPPLATKPLAGLSAPPTCGNVWWASCCPGPTFAVRRLRPSVIPSAVPSRSPSAPREACCRLRKAPHGDGLPLSHSLTPCSSRTKSPSWSCGPLSWQSCTGLSAWPSGTRSAMPTSADRSPDLEAPSQPGLSRSGKDGSPLRSADGSGGGAGCVDHRLGVLVGLHRGFRLGCLAPQAQGEGSTVRQGRLRFRRLRFRHLVRQRRGLGRRRQWGRWRWG